MSAKKPSGSLVLGGEPRIDLLPLEIKRRKGDRQFRRLLAGFVVVTLIVCIGGYALAASMAATSQSVLETERLTTARLLKEQQEYSEVSSAASDTAASRSAALVGSAYEILWEDYLDEVRSKFPKGVEYKSFSANGLSVLDPAVVPTGLLENDRIASLDMKVLVPGIKESAQLLARLETVKGWAGSKLTTIEIENGIYYASYVLYINTDALERRLFENKVIPTEETEVAPDESTQEDN